jgi:hypothetical protein
MLEQVESKRIQIPGEDEEFDDTDLSKDSAKVDDLVSETLAKIHTKQGRKKEALKMYKRLMELNSDKTDHYQQQINKLKKNKD